jgi:hypothetical protein
MQQSDELLTSHKISQSAESTWVLAKATMKQCQSAVFGEAASVLIIGIVRMVDYVGVI